MEKETKEIRDRLVTVRMTQTELTMLVKFRERTSERTNSNYLRKLALHKPVTVKVRNTSLDELAAEVIKLRREIHYIGHNFNQAVHKLQTLNKIPEFRHWVQQFDETRLHIKSVTDKAMRELTSTIQSWSQG